MNFSQQFEDFLSDVTRLAVVGVGNELKGDDNAGLLLLSQLSVFKHINILYINSGSLPENYTATVRRFLVAMPHAKRATILLDATDFEGQPGEYGFFVPKDIRFQPNFSTHSLSTKVFFDFLGETMETKLGFVGIQPQLIEFNAEVTSAVRKGVEKVAQEIIAVFQKKFPTDSEKNSFE